MEGTIQRGCRDWGYVGFRDITPMIRITWKRTWKMTCKMLLIWVVDRFFSLVASILCSAQRGNQIQLAKQA